MAIAAISNPIQPKTSIRKHNTSTKPKMQYDLSLFAPPILLKDFSLSFVKPAQPSLQFSLTSDGRAASLLSEFFKVETRDFDTTITNNHNDGGFELHNRLPASAKNLTAYTHPALFVEPVRMTAADYRKRNGGKRNSSKKRPIVMGEDESFTDGSFAFYGGGGGSLAGGDHTYGGDTSSFSLGSSTFLLDSAPKNVTNANIKFVPSMISQAPLARRPKTSPNSPILARLSSPQSYSSKAANLEVEPDILVAKRKKRKKKKRKVIEKEEGEGEGEDNAFYDNDNDNSISNASTGFVHDVIGHVLREEEKAEAHRLLQINTQMALCQQAMFASFPSLMDASSWRTSFDERPLSRANNNRSEEEQEEEQQEEQQKEVFGEIDPEPSVEMQALSFAKELIAKVDQ